MEEDDGVREWSNDLKPESHKGGVNTVITWLRDPVAVVLPVSNTEGGNHSGNRSGYRNGIGNTNLETDNMEINANSNSITANNGVTARFVSKFVLPLPFRLPPRFPPIATFSVGNRLSHLPWISKTPIHSIHSSFAWLRLQIIAPFSKIVVFLHLEKFGTCFVSVSKDTT